MISQSKAFDFLELKVSKLLKCFEQNKLEKDAIKTEGIDRHFITPDIVNILKTEIHDKPLVDLFARERYSYTPLRKVMPQEPEDHHQNAFSRPKSKPQKKEEPKLRPNQKTLNGFFKPKGKGESNPCMSDSCLVGVGGQVGAEIEGVGIINPRCTRRDGTSRVSGVRSSSGSRP